MLGLLWTHCSVQWAQWEAWNSPLAQAGFHRGTSTARGNTPPPAEDTQAEESAHKSHTQPVKYRYLNKNLIVMIPKQNLPLFPQLLDLDPADKVIWNKAK